MRADGIGHQFAYNSVKQFAASHILKDHVNLGFACQDLQGSLTKSPQTHSKTIY